MKRYETLAPKLFRLTIVMYAILVLSTWVLSPACYPTLVPRILPDGWLSYPCRPMEKAGGEQGGRPVNLLDVQTWEEAWRIAKEKYGETPTSCVSCFQQCYAEPSLMQAHPLEYLAEKIRGTDPGAYAPG